MHNYLLYVSIDYSALLGSILITFFVYTFIPIVAKVIVSDFTKKEAHNYALYNSIAWGFVFLLLKSVIGEQVINSGAPILFYFINRQILLFRIKPSVETKDILEHDFVKDNESELSTVNTQVKIERSVISREIDAYHEQVIRCTKCGQEITSKSKFCSYCGTQIGVNEPNKGTGNIVWIKSSKFLVLVAILVSITIIVSVLVSRNLQSIEKQRVEFALKNPLEYWDVFFTSPTGDTRYAYSYGLKEFTKEPTNKVCIVVGVSVKKDHESKYYLDDVEDQGLFTLISSKLLINGISPMIDMIDMECVDPWYKYNVNIDYAVKLKQYDEVNFLFIMERGSTINMTLTYAGVEIMSLEDIPN